jgi:hypothetical protein
MDKNKTTFLKIFKYKACFILYVSAILNMAVAGSNKDLLHEIPYSFSETNKAQPASSLIERTWFYGINIGGYFAHPSTANYYNGSGEHNVETALNRIYNRDRLVNNVDEIIENFNIGELPLNMHYSPAVLIGFFGGINFSKTLSIIGEFNYTKLTVADKFTIYTDKFTSTSEPYILLSDIYATEERIDLRVGVQFTYFTDSYVHPFIESGINITDTKVIENKVLVEGMEFSIREIRSEYYNVRDYGMGFGVYTSAGLQMEISDNFSFSMGGSVSYSQINLGENNQIAPLFTGFVRLNLNEIINPKQGN